MSRRFNARRVSSGAAGVYVLSSGLTRMEEAPGMGIFFYPDDATRITVDDSNKASSLIDRIGGNEITSSGALMPTLGAISPTGRRGLTFTASANHRMVSVDATIANLIEGNIPYSEFLVIQCTNLSASRVIWCIGDSGNSTNCIYDQIIATTGLDNTARGDGVGVAGSSGTVAHTTSIAVLTKIYDGDSTSSWINGVQSMTDLVNARTVAADQYIMGCRRLSGAFGAGMEGTIWAHGIAPNTIWTSQEREAVEADATEWFIGS